MQLHRVRLADTFSRSAAARRARRGDRSTDRPGARRGRPDRAARCQRARPRVTAGAVCDRRACDANATTGYSVRVAVAEPKLLWTPSPERVERATLTRYQRWLAETRGPASSRATTTCGAGRCTTSRRSGARSSSSVGVRFAEAGGAVLGAGDAGRGVVPGLAGQLRRAHLPRQGSRCAGDPPRVGVAGAGELDLGRAAVADGGDRGGAAGVRRWPRATGSPPTCRTSPRRWRRCWPARRSAPCGPRRRPSSAPAA